ncbi:MAG: hypothetical protein AUH19_02910 [Verrucomicrobia bacterium 13_2_20CM_55_10]|nr:MAG: hypothetical protein AUH19_02910 [Verrucomicrobia bacterium 13_2_20CM_55_10]OLB18930.1 MAG: hypothetical protein AUI05_01690 [Verrucomicrobia bacterium 13_2_20CM_2_54_15_9cls]PYI63430.1 MAG: hypothetical protein DMF07_10390 [Verrucomicrobiota bacterium]
MSSLLKYFVTLCISSVLAGTTSINAAAPGFVEGHLKIISPREVELANGTPASITAESYAEYPLIILSRDEKKEIARVTADANGNYRLALPPGDYILDVQGRPPKGHVRAKPQRFTVTSNQIVRVDMDIDTGIR